MSLCLCLRSLWSYCGFEDKLHVTLPAEILINTGRIKWPVLSSQQGNGLMASMRGEMQTLMQMCMQVPEVLSMS